MASNNRQAIVIFELAGFGLTVFFEIRLFDTKRPYPANMHFLQRWPMEKLALGPCPLREQVNGVVRYCTRNERPQRSMKLT